MSKRSLTTVRALRWLLAGVLAVGCGGAVGNGQSTGESHFLDYCSSSCGDGLECISGICTRGCLVGDSQCGALNSDATCTNESVEPGNVAVCDVACQSTSDCAALGTEHECQAGYCRAGSPTGATCTEYWYLTSSSLDSDLECAACPCGDRTACTDFGTCDTGAPIYPCPMSGEIRLDDLSYDPGEIDGDLLTMEVLYDGGCAPHDFALCYWPMPSLLPPDDNVDVDLILLHDAHGDSCEAEIHRTLHFDLSPLSALGAGLLSTPYGLFASGELSCDDRKKLSAERISNLAGRADLSCQTDNDCQEVSIDTACHLGCGALVSRSAAASFEAERARIDETVCAPYEQAGCPAPSVPPCVPPPPLRCVQNRCSY
jgi:hypothetical protein